MSESLNQLWPSTQDAIWITTAQLHINNKERDVFMISEIFNEARKIGLEHHAEATIKQYISSHCVSNTGSSPDTLRYLFRVSTGMYRLYRPEDGYHPSRKNGKMIPIRETLAQKYRYLIDWYENEYCKKRIDYEEQNPLLKNPHYNRVDEHGKIEIPFEIKQSLNLLNGDFVGFIKTPNGRIQLQKMRVKVQAQ